MSSWSRALVTGASSGIGDAIAWQLAASGVPLVAVARDEARLRALADAVPVDCEVLVADLADRAALDRVAARIDADDAPVDLVVNNAGLGFVGPLANADVAREAAMVDVNLVAVHRLSHAAATALVRRGGGGGILNVSSLAAFLPMAGGATYAATKAFVHRLTGALHAELAPHGIHVTELCPGYTRTELQQRAGYDPTGDVPERLWQSADDVAAAGLAGVAANRALVIPGTANRIGAAIVRATPEPLLRRVLARRTR